MTGREQRCKELLERWYQHRLDEPDTTELWELVAEADRQGTLEPMIKDLYDRLEEKPFFSIEQVRKMSDVITQKQHTRPVYFNWRHLVAAASLLVTIGLVVYLFSSKPNNKRHKISETHLPEDVKPPQTNKAAITLSNGSIVYLDSAVNGQLAVQGNVKLVKLANGQITYQTADGKKIKELTYNTLTNPKGSQVIDMMLTDGSHVWLNAGSSITFPLAFISNERKVSITGEAYFEIERNVRKPFKVTKGTTEITVLGTHFNVNAYDDEEDIKVTLLEGSVKVKHELSEEKLQPGQQAQVRASGEIKLDPKADIEQVMAWKNGIFSFYNADVKTIMKQVARWYDIEVQYQGNIPKRNFTGDIPRTVTLSELLKLFSVNKIHFQIDAEHKKMLVMP